MAIGIFDSGLGGLTVLQAVQERLPEVELFTSLTVSMRLMGCATAE